MFCTLGFYFKCHSRTNITPGQSREKKSSRKLVSYKWVSDLVLATNVFVVVVAIVFQHQA